MAKTLKQEIEELTKKSAGLSPKDANANIEKYSADLARAIKDFILKQEFRIDSESFQVDIDSFETNGRIVNNLETDTLYKPLQPIFRFLRRMSRDTIFSEFFENV